MKQILLIAPVSASMHSGNQATAQRWESLLKECGYQVEIARSFEEQNPDILIAIHLRKSHKSIVAFKNKFPTRPIITLAAGTDLYQDRQLPVFKKMIQESTDLSDIILVLQPLAKKLFQEKNQKKIHVVYQSTDIDKFRASVSEGISERQFGEFQVVVVGHPRAIKDPLRAAHAARILPAESNIQIKLLGKTIEPEMRLIIQKEVEQNPRFSWLGELDRADTWRKMGKSNLMVLSSLGEGGANVISEAASISLPTLATKIDGNVGLLGEGYSGFFEVKDTKHLSSLLLKCEQEPEFLKLLSEQIEVQSLLFTSEKEKNTLEQIISNFTI